MTQSDILRLGAGLPLADAVALFRKVLRESIERSEIPAQAEAYILLRQAHDVMRGRDFIPFLAAFADGQDAARQVEKEFGVDMWTPIALLSREHVQGAGYGHSVLQFGWYPEWWPAIQAEAESVHQG